MPQRAATANARMLRVHQQPRPSNMPPQTRQHPYPLPTRITTNNPRERQAYERIRNRGFFARNPCAGRYEVWPIRFETTHGILLQSPGTTSIQLFDPSTIQRGDAHASSYFSSVDDEDYDAEDDTNSKDLEQLDQINQCYLLLDELRSGKPCQKQHRQVEHAASSSSSPSSAASLSSPADVIRSNTDPRTSIAENLAACRAEIERMDQEACAALRTRSPRSWIRKRIAALRRKLESVEEFEDKQRERAADVVPSLLRPYVPRNGKRKEKEEEDGAKPSVVAAFDAWHGSWLKAKAIVREALEMERPAGVGGVDVGKAKGKAKVSGLEGGYEWA